MLFDLHRVYLLNMRGKSIEVCSPAEFDSGFPLDEAEIFSPLSAIDFEQLREWLEEVLYEGFENDKSCFKEVLEMVGKLKNKNNLRLCSFIYSTNLLDKKQEKNS